MFDLMMRSNAMLLVGTAMVLVGCKEGSPPVLIDPGNQIAVVGQEMRLPLVASDPDGGSLRFSFRSSIPGIEGHALVTQTPDGQGLFTYTPVSGHEGEHIFDFVVSDGEFEDVVRIPIEVRGASGIDSAPTFREPKTGLIIEAGQDCATVPSLSVIVEDLDTVEIELTQAAPVLSGATLTIDPGSFGKEAIWKWCPRPEDAEVFQHRLVLSADDGENPATIKEVPIVIRPGSGANCPGGAPTIEHTPQDIDSLQDIAITAEFADDVGISAPVVYYSLENPVVDGQVDFGSLSLANMTLEDGNAMASTWTALIPNPIAAGMEGDSATLYYLIEAVDTDDPEGGCNHRSNSPSNGVHTLDVTHPGNSRGGAAICEPCSFDVQCGDANDLCIQLAAGSFCGTDCDSPCPEGYACSDSPLTSIEGAVGHQCEPTDGVCGGGSDECEGDGFDPGDDTPEGAAELVINGFDYEDDLIICPDNNDYFALEVTNTAQLNVEITGDTPPDIDLRLLDTDLETIDSSTTATSNESVSSPCLEPGTYYALVDIYEGGEVAGNYHISVDFDTEACLGAPCCEASTDAGCSDSATIEMCVCGMDSYCCNNAWDSTCVNLATTECDAMCPGQE
jgi:hypothetical protein